MSKRLIAGLLLICTLTACGQAGPLYRPDAVATPENETIEAK